MKTPTKANEIRVHVYSGCETCRKALKFLAAREFEAEVLPIRETPPTVPELRRMLDHVGGDVRRLFNTSGQVYRTLGIAQRLPGMKVEEALGMLASNGNLVKRPFLLGPDIGLVGFREEEWERLSEVGRNAGFDPLKG